MAARGGRSGAGGRGRMVAGALLVVLGVALFGTALVVLGPLPATLGEFALRWGVRGSAAALVAAGLWCIWSGRRR